MSGLRQPRVQRESLLHALPVAVVTLLFVFALFCAWQTWLIAREHRVTQGVHQAQRHALQVLTTTLKIDRDRINSMLSDAQVAQSLATGDPAARAAAAARARQLLPDAQTIEFFSPSLDSVVKADYKKFGYSKAAQLMEAQNSHAPALLESTARKNRRSLTLAQPVHSADGTLLAYAWVQLPFKPLQQRFEVLDPASGRLELRQGKAPYAMLLLANGSRRALPSKDARGLPIPGSTFQVTAALPQAWIVLPRHWPLTALLALIGFALAFGLLWRRMRKGAATAKDSIVMNDFARPATAAATAPTPATSTQSPAKEKPAAQAPVSVDPSIFRAYDIRGVIGTQLNAEVANLLGRAIGSVMRERELKEIVVGRDGRLSGPELAGALAEGLRATGVDVIDVGAVPTPLVYFATYHYNTGCGVAVTGSHNPPDYNGFKIVIGGETLSEDAIQDLYQRIVEQRLVSDSDGGGSLRSMDVLGDYIERIAGDVQTERMLKIVVDSGNGIAGAVAPQLLTAIGCHVEPLYCDVDGNFPNHHPDPSDPKNLQDLILAVRSTGADLGVAFDGDGDRLGVVTPEGKIIHPDRLLMLFARDVLSRDPGATIIYDVKCSGHLGPDILRHGGSPLMWRTGHSLIKAKMRETDAALAGEMSGHFFFRQRWYGFDDGIYSAARLLEILAADPDRRDADTVFATLPESVSTPELKVMMAEGENHAFVERFNEQARFDGARLTTIDGVRADWPDGWGLVRASNTTPVLVLRFEADDEATLQRIQQTFRQQLLALDADLQLPF